MKPKSPKYSGRFPTPIVAPLCAVALLLTSHLLGIAAAQAEEDRLPFALKPESKNQTMRLTDAGIFPETLTLRSEDSVVFLLNDTSDSLLNFELTFGDRIAHCSGGILRAQEHGKVRSTKPLEPRNFVTTCFHEKGRYPIVVYGLKNHPKGITANVVVE